MAALLGMLFAMIVLLPDPRASPAPRPSRVPVRPTWTALERGHPLLTWRALRQREGTAVDADGQEVTFDPTSPEVPRRSRSVAFLHAGGCGLPVDRPVHVRWRRQRGHVRTASPSTRDGVNRRLGPALRDVACPSTHECVTVDQNGGEVTFDPASPAAAVPVEIDSGQSLDSVACPSVTVSRLSGSVTPKRRYDASTTRTPDLQAIAEATAGSNPRPSAWEPTKGVFLRSLRAIERPKTLI